MLNTTLLRYFQSLNILFSVSVDPLFAIHLYSFQHARNWFTTNGCIKSPEKNHLFKNNKMGILYLILHVIVLQQLERIEAAHKYMKRRTL